jgi:hypothetical protein
MDWIGGQRLVEGIPRPVADIYRWRFGPRATTRRNLEWLAGWFHPEAITWGGQVQDGGAVLGFSFYDLCGAPENQRHDDAWTRWAACSIGKKRSGRRVVRP